MDFIVRKGGKADAGDDGDGDVQEEDDYGDGDDNDDDDDCPQPPVDSQQMWKSQAFHPKVTSDCYQKSTVIPPQEI